MASQDQLNNLVAGIGQDLSGFIGAAVVDMDTGMSLASTSRPGAIDLEVASAYNSEMVKAKFKAINALGITGGLEDMLLTLSDQLHLIRMLDDQMFLYVAVDRHSTNLAMARNAMKSRIAELA